ncbi:MAG: hypothetical protein HYZ45_06935 [Burkholderiales bacterium]|nr:hypothetical protein [Burkholderiales bacterium]
MGVGCVTVNNSACVNGSAVISGAISAVQSGALSGLTAKLQREDASTKKLTYGFAGDLQQVQSYPHEGGLEIRPIPTCRTGNTIGQGTGNKGFAVQNGVDCGSASNGEIDEKISQGFVGDLQQARSLPHEGGLEVKTLPTCSTADAAQAAAKGVSLDASKCQPAKAAESAPAKPIAENGAAKGEPVRVNLAAK